MIWGIVIGTYSSIFIAAPLLVTLGLEKQRNRALAEAEGDYGLAGAMAKELAQYKYPKRRSIAVTTEDKKLNSAEIIFAARRRAGLME